MNGSRVLWFFLTSISAVSLARAQGQPALVPGEEWERLKAQVAEQREQIQQLKAGLEEQKKTIAVLVKPELVATSALHPEPGTESLVSFLAEDRFWCFVGKFRALCWRFGRWRCDYFSGRPGWTD